MTGKLIVFEGPDCVGKTTILQNINQKFRTEAPKIPLTFMRNPHTLRSEIENTERNNWLRMLYLFMKDREIQKPIIEKMIGQGYNVILDRYFYSSCVYQGITGNITNEEIVKAHGSILLKPDLTIILDAQDDIIEKRMKSRKTQDSLELFEKGSDFRRKVRNRYRLIPQNFNECILVNAGLPIHEIIHNTYHLVKTLIEG